MTPNFIFIFIFHLPSAEKFELHISLILHRIDQESLSCIFLKQYTPSMTTIEMRVHMDCAGCESKIKKTLQKLKGVDSIEIDMATQKVTVTGWADQKKVLKAVRKTGRRAELWSLPYNPEHHNGTDYFNISQHHCNGPSTDHFTPQPSSHYNYYKHGYDSHDGSYYHRPPQSTIFGEQTGAAFSDDNPNACSIM